jgi:hypothetical protein
MKSIKNNYKKSGLGIIGLIVLVAVFILIISYFNISLKNFIESQTTQDNINYVWIPIKNFYSNYIEIPILYIWNKILDLVYLIF